MQTIISRSDGLDLQQYESMVAGDHFRYVKKQQKLGTLPEHKEQ